MSLFTSNEMLAMGMREMGGRVNERDGERQGEVSLFNRTTVGSIV